MKKYKFRIKSWKFFDFKELNLKKNIVWPVAKHVGTIPFVGSYIKTTKWISNDQYYHIFYILEVDLFICTKVSDKHFILLEDMKL